MARILEVILPLPSIEIRFTDMGPGMTDAMKEHVFKRTGQPTEQIVGRGLGLTLTASIIESLGGSIRAENRVEEDPSHGTTIIIRLPAWLEKQEVECGRGGCITFYNISRADHAGILREIKDRQTRADPS